MKQAFVVIGAGFGDEAKGMTTCKVGEKMQQLQGIFRFNGGSQAGHTIEHNGKRIVNQSLNSAASAGVTNTIYTDDVVVSGYVIEQEIKSVYHRFGTNNFVIVGENNPWTCVLDVAANRLISEFNGNKMTCGHGINETLRRNEVIPITTMNAMFGVDLYRKIAQTQKYYIERLQAMGIQNVEDNELFRPEAVEMVTRTLLKQASNSSIITEKQFKVRFDQDLLFEGAQGLMLDQEFGEFPFVTPSNTGLINVVNYLKNNDEKYIIRPIYCTRTFLTRHGDGPFTESNPFVNDSFVYQDKTNVENNYQGKFRLGLLNIDEMEKFIQKDLDRANAAGAILNSPVISVSHLDVLQHTPIRVIKNGKEIVVSNENELICLFRHQVVIRGYGPDVHQWVNYLR